MNELSYFDSLFDALRDAAPNVYTHAPAFSPKVDVLEEKDSYILEMELPGRCEKDVNIELNQDILTISSVKEDKKEEKSEKNKKYLLKERRCSSFERRFTLPKDVAAESISASFKNGILTINMVKKAEASPKMIEIKAC